RIGNDTRRYRVTIESERSDLRAVLLDEAGRFTRIEGSGRRFEGMLKSASPKGSDAPPPLVPTTLDGWAEAARQFPAGLYLPNERLHELTLLEIARSADVVGMFQQFVKRFSYLATSTHPLELASIVESGGGDCKSLTFLLLNLLRWNGVDAELVLLSST